jgi:hypothetical protein
MSAMAEDKPEREHHWDAQPGDGKLIARHILRQEGVAPGMVRLDTGEIVRVGRDAEGEGE